MSEPGAGPTSVAPVSRDLPVADVDQSRAFYRDVLGFEVRPGTSDYGVVSLAEVLWGPARIRLIASGRKEREGRQIVFMETDDVDALRADVLGFSVTWQGEDLAYLKRDRVTVVLLARTARYGGIGSSEFYVANVDALQLVTKGAAAREDPVSYPWGMRAFVVEDPWGNRLTFIQTFE